MKYFSMFSGIGGFDLALNRQGHQCIGYSEINKYSVKTYQKNFGQEVKNYGDATKIDTNELPDFDFLCGGFPCQAFSIAGRRKGFGDTRGTLFFEIARILEAKRPPYFLLENVKGLLNHNKGETFKVIIQTLDELGYDTQWMVFNSKFFGVPQNRERVFIVGSVRGQSRPEILPFGEIIGETKELVYAQKSDREIARVYSPEGIAPTLHLKTGGWQEPKILDCYNKKVRDDCCTLTEPHHNTIRVLEPRVLTHSMYPRTSKTKKGGVGHLVKDDETSYCLDSGNNQAIQPIIYPTLTTELAHSTGRDFFRNGGQQMLKLGKIRRLTPIECERLQGFPDNWTEGVSDTRRYNQCGNAVTVNVIEAIIDKMFKQEGGQAVNEEGHNGIPPKDKSLGILPTIL